MIIGIFMLYIKKHKYWEWVSCQQCHKVDSGGGQFHQEEERAVEAREEEKGNAALEEFKMKHWKTNKR